mmetsp:Transcript_70837/g.182669  ORF Transcript_70837/g.182669 Transcript_70837/m.182669 type:complete len:233 (-) Transcript_70837:584-1282(-)
MSNRTATGTSRGARSHILKSRSPCARSCGLTSSCQGGSSQGLTSRTQCAQSPVVIGKRKFPPCHTQTLRHPGDLLQRQTGWSPQYRSYESTETIQRPRSSRLTGMSPFGQSYELTAWSPRSRNRRLTTTTQTARCRTQRRRNRIAPWLAAKSTRPRGPNRKLTPRSQSARKPGTTQRTQRVQSHGLTAQSPCVPWSARTASNLGRRSQRRTGLIPCVQCRRLRTPNQCASSS